MPFDNLAKKHFTEAEKQQLDEAFATINSILASHSYKLNAKERSLYGKIGDQKRLLIEKVRDIKRGQPHLCSPDVDWNEFEADYQTRLYASSTISTLKTIMEMVLNIRILHDYDNLKDALQEYRYCGYKNRFSNQTGYAAKIEAMKGFFPKTGKTKKKEE